MLQRHSTFWSMIVFLVGVFVPVIGHILDTILILRSGHSWAGKTLWLLIVWLFPFIGALLYMLFGQRPRQTTMPYPAYPPSPYSHRPSSPIIPKPF